MASPVILFQIGVPKPSGQPSASPSPVSLQSITLTNGHAEKADQQLDPTLRCLVSPHPSPWASQFTWGAFVHNMPTSATGMSPLQREAKSDGTPAPNNFCGEEISLSIVVDKVINPPVVHLKHPWTLPMHHLFFIPHLSHLKPVSTGRLIPPTPSPTPPNIHTIVCWTGATRPLAAVSCSLGELRSGREVLDISPTFSHHWIAGYSDPVGVVYRPISLPVACLPVTLYLYSLSSG